MGIHGTSGQEKGPPAGAEGPNGRNEWGLRRHEFLDELARLRRC